MGVPKFYRWISERYPCLSEIVKEYQLPEFDNLYLDMNGIIHNCSHPEDDNPHFRITEEQIFTAIFHYIEVLFCMIKPKKVFFMAIDGVAPRAKMNQQRGRRFRSAREAQELIKQALQKGESLPSEERFDSNCITPGTQFMARLHEQLKFFVAKKVSTDRLWQGLRVYLSGHETPGEGEHKIMDFIRHEKSGSNFDPNTRHCLYGLDADLIMLGLVTHEPHFSLLREEVRFGGKNSQKRSTVVEETTFHLLHLSLMREYLGLEFAELETKLSFEYNVENIIDDWVLMGFLVGNDFIPHLPHIHIHQDCLPLLWLTYKTVLPKFNGYLNEGGYLNLERFEKYLAAVSQVDIENFQENFADMKWAEGKIRKLETFELEGDGKMAALEDDNFMVKALTSEAAGIPTADEFIKSRKTDPEDIDKYEDGVDSDEEDESDNDDDEDDDDEIKEDSDFVKYKSNYYIEKMAYLTVTSDVLESQARGYVTAIQWILHYYYNGVQSWSWYYPHHYAPYLSDIRNFKHMKLEFELGQPFLPFQQLMAVLPTASKALLPKPLQTLMVNDTSPIIDYYPVDFSTDLNGKQQEWEAVVLIPFINEVKLLEAMEPLIEKLSDEEKACNRHGPHILFEYSPQSLGVLESSQPDKYPPINNNHALVTLLPQDGFAVPIDKLYKGLCKGVRQDVYFPGFPTLKHIQHTAMLRKAGVKVFQMASRNDNMILNITEQPQPELEEVARQLIGRSVFTNWPHLQEALVVAVSNDEIRYSAREFKDSQMGKSNNEVQLIAESLSMNDQAKWHQVADSASEMYKGRLGIFVGPMHTLVYAKPMSGRRYICGQQGLVTLQKQWQKEVVPHLSQTVVIDICVHDKSFTQFKTVNELFPLQSMVFLLGNPHYGSMGEVLGVDVKTDARVRVSFTVPSEPVLARLRDQHTRVTKRYFPANHLTQRLGITPNLFSRVTGTVFLFCGSKTDEKPNRINIGLNLKFNKSNQEVPGYSMKVEGEWLYSTKVVDVLADYLKQFPELFQKINQSKPNDNYYSSELFPDQPDMLKRLSSYVDKLTCRQVAPANHGSSLLDEFEIKEIEQEVAKIQQLSKKKRRGVKMQVRPHLLYQPMYAQCNSDPDSSTTFELFDRVVNVRDGHCVPLGLRGTVTGISSAAKSQDVMYEVVFDEPMSGGLTLRCSPNRAYRLPSWALINISHGERIGHAGAANELDANFKADVGHNAPSVNTRNKGNMKDQRQQAWNENNIPQVLSQHSRGAPVKSHPEQRPAKGNDFATVWTGLQSKSSSDNTHSGASLCSYEVKNSKSNLPHNNNYGQSSTVSKEASAAAAKSSEIDDLSRLFGKLPITTAPSVLMERSMQPNIESAAQPNRVPISLLTQSTTAANNTCGLSVNVQDLFRDAKRPQSLDPKFISATSTTTSAVSKHAKQATEPYRTYSQPDGGSLKNESKSTTQPIPAVPYNIVERAESNKTNLPSTSNPSGSSVSMQSHPLKQQHGDIQRQPVQNKEHLQEQQQQQQQLIWQQQMLQQHVPLNQYVVPPPVQQGSLTQSNYYPPQSGSCENLVALCQARGMLPPSYAYFPQPDGIYQARVIVSNGATFVGSVSSNQKLAIESAASVAVYNLQATAFDSRQGVTHPPRSQIHDSLPPSSFHASPNSAVTPTQGSHPSKALVQKRPVSSGKNGQDAKHPASHCEAAYKTSSGKGTEANFAPQQFIPTQVLQLQKTPQKIDARSTTFVDKCVDVHLEPLDNDQECSAISSLSENNSATNSSKKKPRSRIAAQFGS